jgi:hypothetical protein
LYSINLTYFIRKSRVWAIGCLLFAIGYWQSTQPNAKSQLPLIRESHKKNSQVWAIGCLLLAIGKALSQMLKAKCHKYASPITKPKANSQQPRAINT